MGRRLHARAIDKVGPGGALLAAYPVEEVTNGGIAGGPDGWWAESQHGRIGRITPDGAVTTFPLPYGPGGIYDVAGGADGNVWYTDPFGNGLGYYGPLAITAGTDGNVWYAKARGRIGRVTPAGLVTEYVLPAGMSPGPSPPAPPGISGPRPRTPAI